MTYQEQLETPEWKAKRRVILNRDQNCCTKCHCERTKFLGLSQKFGIKTYNEMQSAGYTIGTTLDEKNQVSSMHKGFLVPITLIDDSHDFSTYKLKFAMQWRDAGINSKFELGGFRLICFTTNISENDKFPDLNIHHKYYLLGRLAWEYEDNALITLCYKCHQDEHDMNEIFVYAKVGEIAYVAEKCGKCKGSGYLREYNYYQSGICFECHGHGVTLK